MKSIPKLLSIILVLVLSFSLISCEANEPEKDTSQDNGKVDDEIDSIPNGPGCGPDPWEFYPEGYTGGFPSEAKYWKEGFPFEIWWVDTYEECIEAIELLKLHGSSFKTDTTALFSCEDELFDVKYCFTIFLNNLSERIKFGDNPFDRRAEDVFIQSWIFFDEVTIDEINYGNLEDYHVYIAGVNNIELLYSSTPYTFEWKKDNNDRTACFVSVNDDPYCRITLYGKNECENEHMPDECVNALLGSIQKIDLKREVE